MNSRMIETRPGITVRVFEAGSGAPLVFLHGAGGLFGQEPFLDRLAEHYRVFAPELPGFGESSGEELLEDMQDFTLHGLGCGQRPGAVQAPSDRSLHGRDDRGRNGLCGAERCGQNWSWSPRPAYGLPSSRFPICFPFCPTNSPSTCFTTARPARPC